MFLGGVLVMGSVSAQSVSNETPQTKEKLSNTTEVKRETKVSKKLKYTKMKSTLKNDKLSVARIEELKKAEAKNNKTSTK